MHFRKIPIKWWMKRHFHFWIHLQLWWSLATLYEWSFFSVRSLRVHYWCLYAVALFLFLFSAFSFFFAHHGNVYWYHFGFYLPTSILLLYNSNETVDDLFARAASRSVDHFNLDLVLCGIGYNQHPYLVNRLLLFFSSHEEVHEIVC